MQKNIYNTVIVLSEGKIKELRFKDLQCIGNIHSLN